MGLQYLLGWLIFFGKVSMIRAQGMLQHIRLLNRRL